VVACSAPPADQKLQVFAFDSHGPFQ